MKILIFAGYFYPHKGGLEDYVHKLALGLVKKKYDIDILTTNSEKVQSHEKKDGFNIYRLDCWNFLNNKYPIILPSIKNFKIIKNLLKNNYAFVNTHTRFWMTSSLGLIFSKFNKIPLIHVEHGTCHTEVDSKFISLTNKMVDHTFGSWIVKSAKIRIGVSEASLDFMEHLGKRGDIKISKGLDLKKFKKIKSNLRKKLKIKKEDFVICYIGRAIYAKGVHDLIFAFNNTQKKNLKLLIVGDGDYKSCLKKLADKNRNILFLGEKNEKEVIEILSISNLFVNPSYSEGLPTTVLEAGAVGLPVIATDVGGTKEVIINKKTGLLVKPKNIGSLKDAINKLLENKSLSNKFSRNLNRLIKKEYSYKNMITKFNEVYENEY